MKKILQKICLLIAFVIMICTVMPVWAANFEITGTCRVQADGGSTYTVKTLDYSYDNNTYLSLRDMAMVLKDTDKSFSLEILKNAIALNPGETYVPVGGENTAWENEENPNITLRRNEFKVDEQIVSYYTLIMEMPSGYYDCFMMAVDLAMILNVDISVPSAGTLQIHTQDPFCVSPDLLEEEGYFYGVNSVLAGDATTGEIYYQYQSDTPYPIASTSKLMTCLLAMEAIASGQLTYEEQITVSDGAQLLADSSDGVIPLKAGEQITVQELLIGALLPSSNECALCLAETIAGSEEAFVQMMNQKALDLGLSQTIFFNCNGLPVYTEDPIPAKQQNRMSAEDMFRMVSYFLKVYPQITDITSLESAVLDSLDMEVRNTNPLLHNMPEVTGLKTGTTNKAGACLITSLTADDGTLEHDLVVVVLGTEDSMERGRVSELLARYALQVFDMDMEKVQSEESSQPYGNLPTHAEAAVEWVLQTAKEST